jgi:4-azaleucine resistance transporter AzlC
MHTETRELSSFPRTGHVPSHQPSFIQGVKAALPIAVGYIPIAVTFGLLAKEAGVPNSASILMSLLVYAGASQFVGVHLLALGTSHWEIVFTTFILNLRHFLMSASICQRMDDETPKKWRALLAFGLTDETFSVASMQQESRLSSRFLFGLNLTAFGAWNLGTWAGLFLASGLPPSIQASMGIALYAMFLALLIPSLRRSREVCAVTGFAVVVQSILHWFPLFRGVSDGWGIMIATILSACAGALMFPKKGEES